VALVFNIPMTCQQCFLIASETIFSLRKRLNALEREKLDAIAASKSGSMFILADQISYL
jgi:hypothetical protein